ncbi:hypothetical protein SPSIL_026340 [Sporomusa silvacetica DSM 10669]|uniref:Uncharacterized protein n=1 Tax=Sporomusa silvacetica DSM 10669 TaxID=1123289 RepID=A0ABZ3ILE4_9FIRM|nr:hypothetical protein [Sporomusa silvacetica]OZC22989.1 hypothetical protein SPSIL_03430 [Sporomusa silvacetica DSM 10669]
MNQVQKNKFITIDEEQVVSSPLDNQYAWHKPVITRLDMKKTLLTAASGADSTTSGGHN